MKKVLIITYYWPPSGGAGVHRWLKISKYLAENNTCYIYTPENPDFALQDETLLSKVSPQLIILKKKILEPYFIYKAFLKKSDRKEINTPAGFGDKDQSFIKRMATWIRGNIFVPDPRIFWIRPSFRHLKKVIKKEGIDVIITTGPPHSMHLIGYWLKKHFGSGINWIADFRDPWTKIDFYDKLNIGKRADKKNKRLERNVISSCDTLVSVSKSWAEDFKSLGANQTKVITNGFDPDDYQFKTEIHKDYFCLTHVGSINADRNPKSLWKAVDELCKVDELFRDRLKIKLIGGVHPDVIKDIDKYGLTSNLIRIPYLPHKEALEELHNSSVSLLLLNDTRNIDGIIPGKLFEYIGVANPIFAIGKTGGDSGKIIKEHNLGIITDFKDVEGAKAALLSFYEDYQANALTKFSHEQLAQFSIKHISKLFEEIF